MIIANSIPYNKPPEQVNYLLLLLLTVRWVITIILISKGKLRYECCYTMYIDLCYKSPVCCFKRNFTFVWKLNFFFLNRHKRIFSAIILKISSLRVKRKGLST